MSERSRLDDWIEAARDDLAQREPDLLAEQQLLARVREVNALQSIAESRVDVPQRNRRTAPLWRRWSFGLPVAAAAALVMAVAMTTLMSAGPEAPAVSRTPFFALVAPEAMAAERSALLVSSHVSGANLADYGLPIDPARVDQPIPAEFLLSRAGVVLAVRFTE